MVCLPFAPYLTVFQKFFGQRPKNKPKPWQYSIPSTEHGQAPLDTTSTFLSRHRDLGLQVLHEPKILEPTASRIVNIIFVHGLGGSMRETWTHSSNTFWPTLLHEDDRFSNVRIFTFGYDANFMAGSNVLGIPDFAKQLLNAFDLQLDKYGKVSIAD